RAKDRRPPDVGRTDGRAGCGFLFGKRVAGIPRRWRLWSAARLSGCRPGSVRGVPVVALDIGGQAQGGQREDGQIGDIQLPPAVAVRGRALVGVVVVVPALAVGDERNEPVVAAVLSGVVRLVSEQVAEGVHAPGDVPDQHSTDNDAPDDNGGGELGRGGGA